MLSEDATFRTSRARNIDLLPGLVTGLEAGVTGINNNELDALRNRLGHILYWTAKFIEKAT